MRGYYFDSEDETLESIEEGINEFERIVKGSMVSVAIGLGRIKRDRLYEGIVANFKDYLYLKRTGLTYKSMRRLSIAGENILKYRKEIEENAVKLSSILYKISYLNDLIVEKDPFIWQRIQDLPEDRFKSYVRAKTARL